MEILIVDENDQPVGSATRQEAWAKGLIHRIVFVMVEDESGRILLQKRLATQKLWPGRWTVAASGHVDAGEEYDVAAQRETAEEIGIKNAKLETIGTFFYDGSFEDKLLRRFDRVYRTVLPSATKFNIQADELSEVKWFTLAEVHSLIAQDPEALTPILIQIMKDYYGLV